MCWAVIAGSANAATQITLTGPQSAGPIAPDVNGRFAFPNVQLKRNSVNKFTVTAKDDFGNTLSKDISITQLSLQSVVVSKITTQPLSVQEVQQLVSDGTIKLSDPANFNVSIFRIVLTVGNEPLPIAVPIATPKTFVETGSEEIAPVSDPGDGRSNATPNVQVIVFSQPLPAPPGQLPPPPIPGVIIIEGRIKTLKEFYSVRLLLMNISGIFTLSNVRAEMEFPSGGLSQTLPSDGIISFGDILPGTEEQPGQAEREFIIRGDEIGVRPVKINFGGTVTGPGIPEDTPIPFNGSAQSTVEVKGPPTFQVQVVHPPAVIAGVPYELTVDITNTGETPALYASIDLDVGADARLVDCKIDSVTMAPTCLPLTGPATRNLGNLLPGQSSKQSFLVEPLVSGTITSCMGVADQNITLQVAVGSIGCLIGRTPPVVGVPTGIPTVSVLPTPNLIGVGIDSPVVAFFSEQMNLTTITTGPSGTFRVLDKSNADVPGQLRIENINDNTVAIWQVNDGITNRLKGNSLYKVIVDQGIRDLQGNGLFNVWNSEFTTTDPNNDRTPPSLTLTVQAPVNPNNVIPGQLIRINANAADQGTGVARVELRRQLVGQANAPFELIDQKIVFEATSGPCIFTIDSSRLAPGATYQFKASAYDKAGNAQDATIPVIVAAGTAAPVIVMPNNPAAPVLQGISIDLTPTQVSAGVAIVGFYLDGATQPFSTVTLPPFQASLKTLALPLGQHTVRAVAVDGLNQSGEALFTFTLANNPNKPTVNIVGITNGANFSVGAPVPVNSNVADPVGIVSVRYFLDDVNTTPIASGGEPFSLNTSNIAPGNHKIIVVATNSLGVTNDINQPNSFVNFSVVAPSNGPPPAAPSLNQPGLPVNAKVTLSGSSVAGVRIDITNVTQGLNYSIYANASGAFSAQIDANGGDTLRAVAFNLAQSQQPSAAAQVTVPTPPTLVSIAVAPASISFTALNEFRDLIVTATYSDNSTANVTAQSTFSSSNLGVSSVNAAGRVVALTSGSATIAAALQGKTAQVAVMVNIRTLVSIALAPGSFTLNGTGKFQQLTVTGTFSDNTTSPITTGVTFSSSNPSAAAVNQSGLVSSNAIGGAVITATFGNLAPAQSSVTVQGISVIGIAVSPNAVLFTTNGETRQLQVSRTLSDGTTEPAPQPVTFETNNAGVATVTASGAVSAAANGTATITARHGGFAATVAVTVDIPIIVLPPPVITSIDRPRAGEGDAFVIRGQNFAAIPSANIVRINGVQAQVQSARQDEIVAIVPPGASSGPVQVQVFNQLSNNNINLTIYARIAKSFTYTGAIDLPAQGGSAVPFSLPPFEVRAGDKVFLSSAPDVLAPLNFSGALTGSIDGGADFAIGPTGNVVDLSSAFAPGLHTLDLDLFESGGRIRTTGFYLIAGPDGTGAIAGQRSVVALAQNQPIKVTFTNLRDLSGNLLADGSLVAVTTQQLSLITRDNCCFINSAGGTIVNGAANADTRFKTFTVTGGRIDVQYDPASAAGLSVGAAAVANVQVLPVNAGGAPVFSRTLDHQAVALTTFDTAATPRTQSAVIADGLSKIVTIRLSGIRDNLGNLVPDGAKVNVTAAQMSNVTPDNCCFINSVGGTIINGAANADTRFKTFNVTGGAVEIQYDPGTVQLPVGVVQLANIQVLPARADTTTIGSRTFAVIPVTLSSPAVAAANITIVPPSALADGADNRVSITLRNIADNVGNPVPDGTKVVVTTQQMSNVTPDNCCFINSAGGTIVNGDNNADPRFKTFTITGGQLQIIYSVAPVALNTKQTGVARIQLLPSTPAGVPIGSRTFAVADVNLTGYDTATTSANPPAAIADGFSKIINVRLTGIRDTAGNLVPDGSKIAVTAAPMSNVTPDNCCFINSAGGTLVNGAPNPDNRFKTFTVIGGQVDVQYDPGNIQLAVGTVQTANVQALPAQPDGSRIGTRTFAAVPITLSSESTSALASAVPNSLLANGHDNRSSITVTNIVDALGNAVPNGTKIVATAAQMSNVTPDAAQFINSAGGTIVNGEVNADARLKTFTVNNGQVQIVYSAAPVALNALASTTANVQLLPATPAGVRIGSRTFTLAPITLAGLQSADIGGVGSVARNASASYTVSNIVDTSGNPVPDGTTVVATVAQMSNVTPDNCCFINSVGGAITNGANNADSRLKTFTVQGGGITIDYSAPNSAGAAVIQLLPALPDGTRIGNRTFAVKTVSVQ